MSSEDSNSRNRAGSSPTARHAVVIGGSLAGMLAAAALAPYVDEVTVVERDVLPARPEARRSLPQAHHAHLLWSGGARAIESLLPGTTRRWLAAGARRIPLPTGLVSLSASGWFRRYPEMEFLIACSRDLLDWVVRDQVMALQRVTVRTSTEMLGLTGSAGQVTGVRIKPRGEPEQTLPAALVVDCGGRASRAPLWLEELGVGPVARVEVDSGLAYASRIFHAPAGTENFPIVNVQSDPRVPVPGQTATIMPIENERWLVTLSGTRGGQPSGEADEFEAFARGVRDPVVGELIAEAKPLTEVAVTRSTVNRRHLFERTKQWPEGFVAIGDSVATYNPVYGHGMSVAAQGVLALRQQLADHGGPGGSPLHSAGFARRVQQAVARPVSTAWDLATGQDILYPGAVGRQPSLTAKVLRRYVDRLMLTATGRPLVTKTLFEVMTLSAPTTALLRPEVVYAVTRGTKAPPLTAPPLTEAERRFLDRTDAGT
ncbi:FAD-dependent monooxygenase [Streptomyces sp. NPDC006879]|uniref:FAD-dependent monooxygenase n=1 Tax=Streptomyces sp. NPDC006879 TaxID=3364767 RepID=UPI003674883C